MTASQCCRHVVFERSIPPAPATLQHAHLAEDLGCGQLVAADGAWDAVAAGRGGSPLPSEDSFPDAEEDAVGAAQVSAAWSAPAVAGAAEPNTLAAAHLPPAPVPQPAHPATARLACPAAKPVLPRPPAPYQPLKAAAEAADAARRQEEAAGWRRLRQKADELALWHEYAAQLGISAEEVQSQEQQVQLHSQAADAVQQLQPGFAWSPEPAAGQAAENSWGAQQPLSSLPSPVQQRLWRPVAHNVETVAAAAPDTLASPLLEPSCGAASSCTEGSSTPASSSCLASEESSSLLSSAATSSSLGVAARCAKLRWTRHWAWDLAHRLQV